MKIKIKCVESSVETERSFGLMTDLCEGEKQFKSRSHIGFNDNKFIGKRINGLRYNSSCKIMVGQQPWAGY